MTTTFRRLAVVAALKDGQWVWAAGEAPQGSIPVVANLDQQLGYVCRNGVLIGWTTISTGKEGYDTSTGVFHTLQKDR